MRLSDAAVLGDSLRARDPYTYLERDKNGCVGCLIGGAILAMGGTREEDMLRLFPWLSQYSNKRKFITYNIEISRRFFDVDAGKITFESLIGYIKSVEPSCGDCNSFTCSCVKAEAVPETESVTA